MSITGERLKSMREARGLTQEEVADQLNVTRGAVGHWERGKNEPSFDILLQLARLYNTSTAYLIGETDDPSPLPITAGAPRDSKVRPPGWDRLSKRQREHVAAVTDEVRELLVKRFLRENE